MDAALSTIEITVADLVVMTVDASWANDAKVLLTALGRGRNPHPAGLSAALGRYRAPNRSPMLTTDSQVNTPTWPEPRTRQRRRRDASHGCAPVSSSGGHQMRRHSFFETAPAGLEP
jgi:hypothetical protein